MIRLVPLILLLLALVLAAGGEQEREQQQDDRHGAKYHGSHVPSSPTAANAVSTPRYSAESRP